MPREVESAGPVAGGATPKIGRAAAAASTAKRAPKLLKFHPERWQVKAGKLVPLLGDDVLVSGLNAVRILKGGVADIDRLVISNSRDGWKHIPLELGPLTDAEGGRTYLRDVTGGGFWATAWELVHPARPDLVDSDEEGFVAWLRKLVDAGHIPAPRLDILRAGLNAAKNEAAEMRRLAKGHGRFEEDAERAAESVKVWKAELDKAKAAPDRQAAATPKIAKAGGAKRAADDLELTEVP